MEAVSSRHDRPDAHELTEPVTACAGPAGPSQMGFQHQGEPGASPHLTQKLSQTNSCLLRKKWLGSLGNREVGRRWGRGSCIQNIYMKNFI